MIAVNSTFRRLACADVVFACDRNWWEACHDDAAFECRDAEFWTVNRDVAKIFRLNWVDSEPGGGLSPHPNTIRQGGNSGYQAVSLAILFGAARIVLVGFDMQFTGGRKHWHGDHRGKMHNPTETALRGWRMRFKQLAAESPVPIVNATRETALTCFPRLSIEDALGEDFVRC